MFKRKHFQESNKERGNSKLIILFPLFFVLLSSCNRNPVVFDNKMHLAFDFSGKNQFVFKEVLSHYAKDSKDSLKYKAAVYLISNMTGHFSYAGYEKEAIDTIVSAIVARGKQEKGLIWNFNSQHIVDSIWDKEMYSARNTYPKSHYIFDNKVITKEYLIRNIDDAFLAWKLPWSKHVSFENFCEYILPYRIYDEPLEYWREQYANEFAWVKKSMLDRGSNDPIVAANLISDTLFKSFTYLYKFQEYPAALGAHNLLKGRMGDCLDEASIRIFAMRALGIPVALEQVPRWADRSLGHAFISVLNKNQEFVDVTGARLGTELKKFPYVPPKVYRTQFFTNDLLGMIDDVSMGSLDANMERFQVDVTKSHINTKDLRLEVNTYKVRSGEKIYLCIFDDQSWSPFTSTIVDTGGLAIFQNIGLGAIYLPVVIRDKTVPVGDPVLLDKNGELSVLKADLRSWKTFLFMPKYYQSSLQTKYFPMIRNGIIEGANKKDFSDAKILLQVWKSNIGLNLNYVGLDRYRYVRYKFPEYGDGSISDLSFYNDSSLNKILTGTIINSDGLKGKKINQLFDGRLDNCFYTEKHGGLKGEWVGIDFQKPQQIGFIGIAPRHDMTSIKKDKYELFYWNDGWVSLGLGKLLPSLFQEFKKVPKGALLMVRTSKNTDKRIFILNNDKISWW